MNSVTGEGLDLLTALRADDPEEHEYEEWLRTWPLATSSFACPTD